MQERLSDMSKTVSSSEIEDVLSSIRRLVAAEPAEEKPSETTDEDHESQRLVLTPAFRVSTQPVETAHVNQTPSEVMAVEPETDALTRSQDSDVFKWAQTIGGEEGLQADPKGDVAGEDETDGNGPDEVAVKVEPAPVAVERQVPPADLDADAEDDAVASTRAETPSEQDRVLDFSALGDEPIAEWQNNAVEGPGADAAYQPLSAKAAELEAAVDDQPSEFEPDGSEEDTHTPTELPEFIRANSLGQPMEGAAPAEDTGQAALQEVAVAPYRDDAAFPSESEVSEADEPQNGVSDDIRQVVQPVVTEAVLDDSEAALTIAEGDSPPANTEVDIAAVDLEVQAVGSTEPKPSDIDLLQTDQQADALDLDTRADEAPLSLTDVVADEDRLREMITEILREELHGPMGERMTQNVRKLVRREIHRVLAAKDFD